MKKSFFGWICALLIVALLIPLGGNTFAADAAENSEYDRAFSLLSYLKIYDSGMTKERADEDGTVSRGDFAVYIARLLNVSGKGLEQLYYTDVPESHYAFPEITVLTEMGYISGTGEKKFEPEADILPQHAGVLLLKTLGLNSFIASGNADDSFVHSALRKANLSVGTGESITFRKMTVLLYRALQADYYKLVSTGGKQVYSEIEGGSLLYESRKLRFAEKGMLTAANGADIYGAQTDANSVVIDGVRYYTEGINYYGLLGMRVDYVYSDEDDRILYWAYDSGVNNVVKITLGREGGYDAQNGRFWYMENGHERRVSISSAAVMVYNGRPLGINAAEALSKPHTKVTLLSTKRNGAYDIVLIESCRDLIVSGKSAEGYVVRDHNSGDSVDLDPGKHDVVSIENFAGNPITPSDIRTGTVLSVFESQDGGVVRAVVSDEVTSGVVKQISNDGTVTIDGLEYETYSDDILQFLKLGATVTCSLDFQGYIASAQTNVAATGQFVGFALAGVCKNDGFDDVLYLKILSETGEIADYKAAGRLNINDYVYKDMDTALAQLSENKLFKPQIMICRLNSEGVLTRIDTAFPDDGGAHPLTVNREIGENLTGIGQAMYQPAQSRIGVNMLTDSNTVVFSVPQNIGNDYSRCYVATLRAWDDYRGATSYRTTKEDTFFEQYVVTRQINYGSVGNDHPIRMIADIIDGIDNDGNPTKIISYSQGSGFTEVIVDENTDIDYYHLHRGDVVRLGTNASNKTKVEVVSVISRVGDTAAVGVSLRLSPYGTRTISCYAYDKKDYALKVGWDKGENFDEILKLTQSTPVVVYDSKLDKIYLGSIDDIETYRNDGKASRLIVQSLQGALQRIMVQK